MATWEDPIFPRLASRPVDVLWAGFKSDTFTLQQAGWSITMEQDIRTMTLRMCMEHKQHRAVALSQRVDMYHFNDRYNHPDNLYGRVTERMYIHMEHLARDIRVADISGFVNFKAVDAEPRLVMQPEGNYSLRDILPFAEAPLVRTQALILPEATVDDLLKEILDRQQEAKTIHFQEMERNQRMEFPQHKVHAQIISLTDRLAA